MALTEQQILDLIEKTNKLEAQVQELQNQMTLLRGLPPFMAKAEHR
jgi:prefoldin subunit 5